LLAEAVAAAGTGGPVTCAMAARRAGLDVSGRQSGNVRAPVEHGFSDLKNWRILTRLRLNPGKATTVLRALLVLTRQHITR
jgi:hypothetical protein